MEEEISYWVEVIGEQQFNIVRYSKHDWVAILRTIADDMEREINIQKKLLTNQ